MTVGGCYGAVKAAGFTSVHPIAVATGYGLTQGWHCFFRATNQTATITSTTLGDVEGCSDGHVDQSPLPGQTGTTFSFAYDADNSGSHNVECGGGGSNTVSAGSDASGWTDVGVCDYGTLTVGSEPAGFAADLVKWPAPSQTAPSNTTLPSISGSAQDGKTLTAANGSWSGTTPLSYGYLWQSCDASGANCQSISGATASTYTVGSGDIGNTIRVKVTATNSAGSATATSSQTSAVTAAPPSNTTPPAITGTAEAGQQLTATQGSWSGTGPISYTYQWQDCDGSGHSCQNIAGATQASYTVASADVGSTLVVVVTAANTAGSSSASSSPTPVAGSPWNTSPPTISGTAEDGQTLTASNGQWGDTEPLTYTYQWQSCNSSGANCTNISGATASTYQLGPSDVAGTVRVIVTATNTVGSTNAASGPSGTVTAAPAPSVSSVSHSNLPSGSVYAGTDSVTATASSTGPGVKELKITDQRGDVVADYTDTCAGTNSNPCPGSRTQSLTVDYTKIPLGQDTLSLVAIDAAGLASAAQTWTVTDVAPPSCTDNWTGTGGDSRWQTAGNWSEGTVPGDHDHACAPTGITIQVTSGTNPVGRADIQGTLQINGGTLTVDDASAPSTTNGLVLSGGTLGGAGAVDVSGPLSWTSGTMSGSGSTVLQSGGSGTINPGANASVTLDTRSFSNQGTLTLSSGVVKAGNGAVLTNSGTLNLNSEDKSWSGQGIVLAAAFGATPELVNTSSGLVDKAAGTGTTAFGISVDNQGTLDAQTGQLAFPTGSATFESSSTLIGTITLNGATINMQGGVNAQNATIQLQSGTLTDGNSPDPIGNLIMSGGTLNGSGEVDLSGLTWTGGTMSGAGSTVLENNTASIAPPNGSAVTLDTRALTTMPKTITTFSSGTIKGYNGAPILNNGTLYANSEDKSYGSAFYAAGGLAPVITNAGTWDKNTGTGDTTIGFPFNNESTGTLQLDTAAVLTFTDGSPALVDGTLPPPGCDYAPTPWQGKVTTDVPGAEFNITSGCVTMGLGSTFNVPVVMSGGTMDVACANFGNDSLNLEGGTLNVDQCSSPVTVGQLTMSGGTLTGAGEIDVCNNLTWSGGTMTGGGSTVICPGGSGQLDPPSTGTITLDDRALTNDGALTWSSGCVSGANAATITNTQTFYANSECVGGLESPDSDWRLPLIANSGAISKSSGSGTTTISWPVINDGSITESTGKILLTDTSGADVTSDASDPPMTTPAGRELSDHALEQTQERDIPLSEIDDVIDKSGDLVDRIPERDRNVYYDPTENLTVVSAEGDSVIITAHWGHPEDAVS